MNAKVNDKVKTLVMVEGIPKERAIPVGSIGVVIEAYKTPEAEGYAVDFAFPDNSLVGDFAYANAYLDLDQFEVVNESMNFDGSLNKIYNLLALPDGWNGYDGSAPEYGAVEYAHHWISLLYRKVISLEQQWCAPNVTASGEGEVVFEWWQGSKKLTVYVGNQSAEYVKVWGPDIDMDMEDGQAESPEMLGLLWKWLMS